METIGELDQEHPQPPAGAEEDLAVGQVLQGGPVQVMAGQLRASVNQFGNNLTELLFNIFQGYFGYVFNNIMQERSSKQDRVFKSQLPREDLSYRTGMADVGGAGLSLLTFVEFVSEFQSAEKRAVLFVVWIDIFGNAGTIVVQVKSMGLTSGSCGKNVWGFTLCDPQSPGLLAHQFFSLSFWFQSKCGKAKHFRSLLLA
jgi:hypothetical protein